MKNLSLAVFTLLSCASAFAQNSNPWPASGNVGIGTDMPSVQLDVVNQTELRDRTTMNYAYFGTKINLTPPDQLSPQVYSYKGLYVQQTNLQSNSIMRLQSVYPSSRPTTSVLAGYIEFNQIATPNTARSAISFGYASKELMRINQEGKVRIASQAADLATPDGYRLFVQDGILTEKVKVALRSTTDWADYVFAENYKLMPLADVEAFTQKNGHLPNVPSAKEMVDEGLDVAKMDAKLLEKIEELTLYIIKQDKELEELKAAVKALQSK